MNKRYKEKNKYVEKVFQNTENLNKELFDFSFNSIDLINYAKENIKEINTIIINYEKYNKRRLSPYAKQEYDEIIEGLKQRRDNLRKLKNEIVNPNMIRTINRLEQFIKLELINSLSGEINFLNNVTKINNMEKISNLVNKEIKK